LAEENPDLAELLEQSGASLSKLDPETMKRLAEAMRDSSGKLEKQLAKLVKAKLAKSSCAKPGKCGSNCQSGGPGGDRELAEWLEQNAPGADELRMVVMACMAPGSGEPTRGRGDAALLFSGETAGFAGKEVDLALAGENDPARSMTVQQFATAPNPGAEERKAAAAGHLRGGDAQLDRSENRIYPAHRAAAARRTRRLAPPEDNTMMTILYILLALVLLGVLITVHEWGHFIAARLTGIAVKEYSIGFGPKLLQWKRKKHETLFTLRPFPLGGYCMFYGDETDPESADDPRAFHKAHVWRRMVTVFSGPLMNFVLAFVVAVGLMAGYGFTATQPFVGDVEAGMPAAQAGLLPGDVITAVNGEALGVGDAAGLTAAIAASPAGEPITLRVLRGAQTLPITVTPAYDQAAERYRIGVGIQAYAPLQTGQILPAAWNSCVYASTAILDALGKLVTTGQGINDTAGPVGVVQM
ncbi:MAG: PDZ domain-containing protein, partial [Opitutae bacterium]|nr:PDZ domain-containing protein [Opitutae bacterium]